MRVDRAVEATLPFHHDLAARLDPTDDAAIASAQVVESESEISSIRSRFARPQRSGRQADAHQIASMHSRIGMPRSTASPVRGTSPSPLGRRVRTRVEPQEAPAAHSNSTAEDASPARSRAGRAASWKEQRTRPRMGPGPRPSCPTTRGARPAARAVRADRRQGRRRRAHRRARPGARAALREA